VKQTKICGENILRVDQVGNIPQSGGMQTLPRDIALNEFLKIYPETSLPAEIRNQGIITSSDTHAAWWFSIIFWFKSMSEPFTLFTAEVNKKTLDVTVTGSKDVLVFSKNILDDGSNGPERLIITRK
jgi:hypothetical protein